jgi:hypothetical protein
MRAERRLGELIKAQKETVGLNKGGWSERNAKSCGADEESQERAHTLAETGIDKKLSSRTQKLAAVPEDEFEGLVVDWRDPLPIPNFADHAL